MGAGRLVVSYDAGQTAIVWDLMTGDEVARFASYEHLTTAAWMRNGNVAFGNTQGNIILFEPTTSEHISARTIDQIAVTSLAPAADCRTFAIGYQNGSLLIATLQPRFTILHNLTTSRAPSPIVTLNWHASSSRQKSDMLAVQTHDGDLRVWSVSKSYNSDDPAKVVRILRRTENQITGPNWMAWSKNGRIIQYSDSIPTLDIVRGLAVYGPGASLFTLGANNTVQQFDLNVPSIIVANVQHPANLLPPSPPVSIEEQADQSARSATTIATDSDATSASIEGVSESDDDHLSPFGRIVRQSVAEPAPSNAADRYDTASPVSSRSGLSSLSRSSAGSATPGRYPSSVLSRPLTENTYISSGASSLRSSQAPVYRERERDVYSTSSLSGTSLSSTRSRRKPSRLRHEVLRSPEDSKVHDLFQYTRSRLSDIPYKNVAAESSRLTNDDLRRQMLSTIFGWQREMDDLVRDELSRHPAGSASRILLSKWLGDIDPDILAANSENMTSSDWMLLALSVWERQAALIKKWGEWAVMHGQTQLAVGCFACTGQESSEPWTSPSAAQVNFQSINAAVNPSIPEILSPPLSPPGITRGPQRSIAKTSALKLITSFGDQGGAKSKFFSQQDGGQTPIAAGVTPIAESAVSPGGFDVTTAFIRPSNRSQFNTPNSARSNTSAFGRKRLPSIGEIPSDLPRDLKRSEASATPVDPNEARRAAHTRMSSSDQETLAAGLSLQRAATASPMMMRDYPKPPRRLRTRDQPPPSPDALVTVKMEGNVNRRNGSRDRIPKVSAAAVPMWHPMIGEVTSPEQSVTSSTRFHCASRRRDLGSVVSSITSQSSTGRSHRSNTTGATRQDYIHSLDTAQLYGKKQRSRHSSREGRQESRGRGERESSRSRTRKGASRERSGDRGRSGSRKWPKAKRSPTSPIPMSPEDLINLSTPKMLDRTGEDPVTARKSSKSRQSSRSRQPKSRTSSRGSQTRRTSPEARHRPPALDLRGRSKGREGSAIRSPSSPVPMSAGAIHYHGSEDEEDYRKAVEAQEKFRLRHNRSASQIEPRSPDLARQEPSESRRRPATASPEHPKQTVMVRAAPSTEHAGDLKAMKDERQRKKEQAARELEERRKSLAKRPLAPLIPHPNDISPALSQIVEAPTSTQMESSPRSKTADPTRSMYARSSQGVHIGLPATPKAMRLIIGSEKAAPPEMPPIPATFAQRHSPTASPNEPYAKVETGQPEAEPLTLLPSTVYQPPTRPMIPRSMSAPIPDEPLGRRRSDMPPPAGKSHGRTHSRGHSMLKGSTSEIRGIDEMLGDRSMSEYRRASHDDNMPPPPPPPPMLKELQHLAMPPPPPPAPLPHFMQPGAGALGTGMIEIVVDDDEQQAPVATLVDTSVPVLAAPPVPSGKGHHSRGRSFTERERESRDKDSSISTRFTKATERFRSASRPRKDSSMVRIRSPGLDGGQTIAPYESVPMPGGYGQHDLLRSPIISDQQGLPTGLHESEMI
ncbi:IDC1 protein [Verticillium alfalfae VaMs.102]|uniref:IDC1 protein n=1 Tax=Verticillium alfalfae (strain VaMs.102 / ATCC MYA-4576 / FGSC 10136) TaxID=526221 RepID=C9SKA4_VERA1|nr:IDC1 protein [Verticillium alfalfae VaMs.102]EEY19122.1 IDC1 protein [Verticillium alfalfae VaMs.102]